ALARWTCCAQRSGASRSVEWTCTRLGGPREPHRYVIAVGIDLTARRAAEQALARSRTEVAQFRQLIERTSFEVWMLGADARIRYVNAAAAASLGYPADALVGRSIADIDADGPARVEAIFDRVVQAMVRGEAVEFEVEHLARDGRRVRKAVRAMLIERDGETVGAMFAQDITERTRALAARAAHERTLHATLDLFPGWVACIDDDGRYVYANERFLDDRGLTREKVIGQSIEDVRGPLKSSRVRPLMARALAGEKFAMERRFFDTRGEQRFYWMTFDAQHDVPVPGRNLYFTFGVDVTDARRNELRLKSILQATRIATWEWSARNGELKVNPQFAELGGRHFDGETVVESMVEVFQTYVHPDDRPLRRKRFASLVSGTTEGFEHEFRIRHADGSWVWLHERANVVARSESGEPLLLIGTLLDVTARKRQEEELQELNAALEARVADRTSALAAATERAERASAAKTEFLSRMSHELRTPLNAILGFSQLLGMGPLPDAQAGTVAEILGAGRHLLALIDEVLDLATVESGGVSLRLEPTAPGPLVDECLALVAPDARRAALEVDNRIGPDCPALLADRMRLRQVVLNLLTNAVKYNRPGGRVTVAARVVGAEGCELRVSDQGLGLAPAQVARLFRPFERLDAKRGSIPGTGIGLAVSKRLVELMGGSIGVDSAVASGSTFWVRLPAAPAVTPGPVSESAPAPGPACAPGSPARACRRVLYVEDNTSNQRLMRDLLTLRGDVELETVGDPRTAVERARAFRPELVLLDIQLPYVDGYRVLQGLRAGGVDAPVVAVSANAMPEDVARGEAAGFAAYLTKPLDVRRVLEVVAAPLDR
ncbi:MAG TPA: PAS domain S-box protein, partial [Burkholderiaceae bacterium]|nr:PAS domain S-box protein [Burkholderiaceae bacterium]